MNPFFSVVIPLFNKKNYIQATLKSVLEQSFTDFEIIIIDDGSTDDSLAKVKALNSEKIKLFQQNNLGASVARNNAIEKANGKFIALLDADDYWYQDHLQDLKALIDQFPDAGLFCTGYEIVLSENLTQNAVHLLPTNQNQIVDNYFKSSLINPVAWTSASCFSKDFFYKIGEFDADLRTGQDIDFFIRSGLKVQIAFTPRITMRYHKKSENNLGKSLFNQDRFDLIKKFKTEEKSNASLKKYLDKNRYALVIRCKIAEDLLWKKVKDDINPKNLNQKQKLLLKMPAYLLKIAVKTQGFLMENNIYLTAFK